MATDGDNVARTWTVRATGVGTIYGGNFYVEDVGRLRYAGVRHPQPWIPGRRSFSKAVLWHWEHSRPGTTESAGW
jgi:hypothetical protein